MQKRVVRLISYEGLPAWLDALLARSPLNRRLRTLFDKQGTVSELQRVELRDGERMRIVVEREE